MGQQVTNARRSMEQVEYRQVSQTIQSLLDIDLSHYKDKQMRRRLDSWLARSGSATWDIYFSLLRADSTERERFRSYLTINVSQFFRDPRRWNTLSTVILPGLLNGGELIGSRVPRLRIWSAGCSIGAETYSLAMLLDELAPGSTHYVLGTDIDRNALALARSGGPYSSDDVREVAPSYRKRYFRQEGSTWFVRETVQRKVQFREQDLLRDDPGMQFDLIVCRNVVIYFTQGTKKMLYQKFASCLKPDGILFLGGTEIIPRPHEFNLANRGISLYGRG